MMISDASLYIRYETAATWSASTYYFDGNIGRALYVQRQIILRGYAVRLPTHRSEFIGYARLAVILDIEPSCIRDRGPPRES